MSSNGWSLETVRGRESGRVYPLNRGATVLGNAPGGGPGLDLGHEEGDSPRRMAARQAQLDLSAQGLTIRDLESPGGTFVNRKRLLPGQSRTLQAGDLIQLGSVQLKVVPGAPPRPAAPALKPQAPSPKPQAPGPKPVASPASVARTSPLSAVFTLASGARCRSWDDFLTVSAQRWPAMRDELVSGRLAAFLASIGRGDMGPLAQAPGTPDERLDAWLGTLPATRPSRPELDVHPAALKLRAAPGGGVMRASVQITNTGYRLLRTEVRVEPASAGWLKVPAEFARGPIVTVDQTDLHLEVHIPETFPTPPTAALVLESNGGTRRVEVRLERLAAVDAIPDALSVPDSHAGLGLRALIARQTIGWRLLAWSLGSLLLRMVVLIAGMVFAAGTGEGRPPLGPAAVLLAVVGCVGALGFVLKHGELRDAPSVGFAGACAGVLAASVLIAACRTIEPMLGSAISASPVAVCILWGALGAGLAGISAVLVPPRGDGEGSS
jgi:hypothetical protein